MDNEFSYEYYKKILEITRRIKEGKPVRDGEYWGLYGFMLSLEDLYVDCSYCGRKIAPNEHYIIGNEEIICMECG